MSNWKLIRLDFGNTPAHFGEVGIGMEETSERVRSDTLFSALAITYARLGKDLGVLLERFQQEEKLPFRLSSTFLFRQVSNQPKPIYYLPKPLKFPLNYPIKDDLEFAKEYKKLKFLPLTVWQRWYQGEGFTDGDREELIAKATKESTNFKELQKACAFSYGKGYMLEKHPKVAIDRTTRATNLYHTAFVRYRSEANEKSGLYFLLDLEDSSLENDLRAALNLLGEEGLGGERSSGAGRFEPSWDSFSELSKTWQDVLNFPAQKYYSLISLYWDKTIVSLDESSYELQERGGWISSPFSGRQQRRKSVRMFTEGSTFPEPPQGKLEDVTPESGSDHHVYRSGIAVSIPIKTQQGE